MALIPGATINGKFKLYSQMTAEELKEVKIRLEIKKIIVLLSIIFASVVFTSVFIASM